MNPRHTGLRALDDDLARCERALRDAHNEFADDEIAEAIARLRALILARLLSP